MRPTLSKQAGSAREKAAWQAARQAGLDSIEDLIFALINTQQFIFVQ